MTHRNSQAVGQDDLGAMDKTICDIFAHFAPISLITPTLIDRDLLKMCGYFKDGRSEVFRLTADGAEGEGASEDLPGDRFLLPAACLHIYPYLRSALANCDPGRCNRTHTTVTRVYRNEPNLNEYTRLNEFTVREYVFVGTEDFVRGQLLAFERLSLAFIKRMGKEGCVMGASDHFGNSRKGALLSKMQRQFRLKRELVAKTGSEKIPIGSFNYHGCHFSEPLGFSHGGEVVTGCVGFGLERCRRVLGQALASDVIAGTHSRKS